MIAAAFLVVGLAAPVAVSAEEESLPAGDMIVDKYAKAVGGQAAFQKLRNRVTKGTLEFLRAGVKGPTTDYLARPAKHYFVWETESLGKIEAVRTARWPGD